MHILADFLNHGILPFTGREEQLAELVAFWHSAMESPGIQLGLLVGEAGSGKSSLVEELLTLVAHESGVAVHVKLYPGSTLSPAPLIARALGKSGMASGILRTAPEENLGGVTAALRRLTHLRPTLLVIEDIHLLGGELLEEFSRLLQALADEPLALLCPSRPPDTAIQGILEHYSLREWHLPGLARNEVGSIWQKLFGAPPGDSIFDALYNATLGNPLALRSALRGVLTSGALARDPQTGLWRLAVTREEFDQTLDRSMRLLSEGMAAHLTEVERRGAEQLACLGELFSRDAALLLLDEDPELIERLMFKGILAVSETPTRAFGGGGDVLPPLAFTHTLLHRRFVESASVNARRLVEVIASGALLYSILPFQLLHDHAASIDASCTAVEGALERIFTIIPILNVTSDWPLISPLWHAADKLVEQRSGCWQGQQLILQQIALLDARMSLYIRSQHSDEYHSFSRRMVELTQMHDTEPFLVKRVRAYANLHMAEFRRNPEKCMDVWNQVEALVQRYPELRHTGHYARYLARLLSTSGVLNRELLYLAEARSEELFASGADNEEFMAAMRRFVLPELIVMFETKEQLEIRLQYLHELETGPEADPYRYVGKKASLRIHAGRLYELWGMIDDMIRRLDEIAELRAASFARILRLFLRATLGEDVRDVDADMDATLASAQDWNRSAVRENLTQYMNAAGILRGDIAWACQVIDRIGCDYPVLDLAEVILYIVCEGRTDLLPLAMDEGSRNHPLHPLARAVQGEQVPHEEVRDAMLGVIKQDLFELFEILLFKTVVRSTVYLDAGGRYPNMLAEMTEDITRALQGWLEWMADNGLWTLMEPMVQENEMFLTPKQKRHWQTTIAALRGTHTLGTALRSSDRVRISMLGTIEVQKPGGELQRLRGPRVCKFLGMLVADHMLDTPLSFREMCRLIAGGDIDTDPERERKALNDAVYRLRDVLGHDSVITERETSRLNTEIVEVDLLQAHRLLLEITSALREGALARALNLLMTVLEIAGTRVPFPGLYDSFFEAARVEFECRLRGSLLDLARRLLQEGDDAGAEELLRRGFAAMPEDEEIVEQLCDILRDRGRFTEAVRIRMRASDQSTV